MTDRSDLVARTVEFARLVQGEGRLDLLDEYVHPRLRNHTAEPGTPPGREGARATMAALHAALDDVSVEIVHCFADGDVVATNKVFSGRHVGDWLGQPPTGRLVSFRVLDFVRFSDGQIIEHWSAVRSLEDVEG